MKILKQSLIKTNNEKKGDLDEERCDSTSQR